MPRAFTYRLFNTLIALVWLVNGLLCKILHLVPRHEHIVARILGDEYSKSLTLFIGLSEVVMAIWILSRWKPKLNAILQMTIVAIMNVLEFALAPDLLLWGQFNALFAFLFIMFVYYNEFILHKKTVLLNKK